MPRIAVIDFPDIDIDEASQIAERLVREFKGAISTAGLARALNMAERGGGFLKKVAALRDYGLVDGRGELRATDLAQRIAYPASLEEKNQLKRQAFLRVGLFSSLADKLGSSVPEEDRFSIFVEEATRAPRMEVARRAARLRRLYAEGAKYLTDEAPGISDELPEFLKRHSPQFEQRAGPEAVVIELRVPTAKIDVKLPMTPGSVEVIVTLLNNLKAQLEQPGGVADVKGNEE